NLTICRPGGVVIRRTGECFGLCAKKDARLLTRHPSSAYYPPDTRCECGDGWSDGWMNERPFQRAWRAKAQARFERDWLEALPEGTHALYEEESGAMLRGVRLPDGKEVLR